MQTSVFLAQLMGPVILMMGISILINPDRMVRIGREFLGSEALILLSGIITLPVGIAIVLNHNIWEADWRIIITLFGWIAIFAGLFRMGMPNVIQTVGSTMLEKKSNSLIAIPAGFMAILGAYLCYHGYL